MSSQEDDERPAKRTRVSATAEDADIDFGRLLEDSDAEPTAELTRFGGVLPRHDDGYVAGSIVRVSMKDFFSYDSIEFRPGPRLNFVVGPNGSGKSTILSAIALALNFPPSVRRERLSELTVKVVDRAKEVRDLVKRDSKADRAVIEIELKNELGKPNIVISRDILREVNKSEFKIDGVPSPARRVSEIVAALHIQVDNICVFMPQEKVRELANKTPAQLLRETEKAAGGPELHSLHEKLIEIKKLETSLAKKVDEQKSNLSSKEDRLSAMQRDLERPVRSYEHALTLEQLTLLGVHVAWAKYRHAKAAFEELKAERDELKQRLADARSADQPLIELQTQLKELVKKLEKQRKACTDKHVAASGRLASSATKLSSHETKSENEKNNMIQIRESDEKRIRNIERLEKQIEELGRKYERGPPAPFDRTEERRIAEELQHHQERIRAIQESQAGIAADLDLKNREADHAQHSFDRLNSITAQRERMLANESGGRDIVTAVRWIRDNRQRFRGMVYDPIQLLVGCKDPRFAAQVESCINQATMRARRSRHIVLIACQTILCANEDDYRLLCQELTGRQGLRLNLATITSYHQLSRHRAPFDQATLKGIRLDCWALDQLIAPDEVLGFLCQTSNVHRTPVTANKDAAVPLDEVRKLNIRRYLTPDDRVDVGYSKYGSKASFEHNMPLRPSRVFAQSVDRDALKAAENDIARCRDEIAQLKASYDELADQEAQIRQAYEPLKAASAEQKKLRQAVDNELKAFNAIKTQLDIHRRRLATEKSKPSGAELRAQSKNKLRGLAREHVKLATTHQVRIETLPDLTLSQKILVELSDLLTEGTKIAFDLAQAAADSKALDDMVTERAEAHGALQQEYDAVSKNYTKVKDAAMDLHKQGGLLQGKLSGGLDQRFADELPAMREISLEEVKERLADAENRLKNAPSVSAAVLQSYTNLQKQVELIGTELASQQTVLEKYRKKLKKHRDRYEPAIDRLIESISRNFSRCFDDMNLLGEVGIDKPDDFAEWGIIIRVSFRREIEMQRLTAQRQSGGERALSTVVYFMSLMRQAKTPFTVVDEINQGMDQRNERAMHEQLVNTTCQDDAGQAWLVTPKLLTGLSYHEHLRVLSVGGGPWLGDAVALKEMVRRGKRRRE